MNGTRGVSAELRERVVSAMADLSYEPNAVARSLKFRRTNVIAMVLPNLLSPFWQSVLVFFEMAARERGYAVLFESVHESIEEQTAAIRLLKGRRVDGIALAPVAGTRPDMVSARERGGIPIVLVDRRIRGSDLGSVVVNNYRAVYEAVTHLIENGCRNIGYLGIPHHTSTGRGRYRGYRQACLDSGIDVFPNMVQTVPLTRSAVSGAQELLRTNPSLDAIFAGNHSTTIAAVEALRSASRRVPDEVAMIGFDDAPWLAMIDPPITVISQPLDLIGRRVAERLIAQIEGGESPAADLVLPTQLIHRTSCGCASRSLLRAIDPPAPEPAAVP